MTNFFFQAFLVNGTYLFKENNGILDKPVLFSFITKTPPAAMLLKKACKIESGSANSKKQKVATISRAEVQKIAELKMPDLNAASIDAAISMIAGTARSMGITVED